MRCYLWSALFFSVLVHLCASEAVTNNSTNLAIRNGLLNFGVKLQSIFTKNNTENKNILFSPINIYAALALLHLGSNGTSRDEISKVIGIPETHLLETFHGGFADFLLTAQKSRLLGPGRSKAVDLKLANGIFVQNGIELKKTYVEDAKLNYKSEIINVDFANSGAQAIDTINKYIANKTENQISRSFQQPMSPDTKALLISSVYFKSMWRYQFEETLTLESKFHVNNSSTIAVQMMEGVSTKALYANLSSLGVKAISLSFQDPAFSMFIVLPYLDRSLREFLSNLTADHIDTIVNGTTDKYKVNLKMPRTTFKWSKSINEELAQLGLSSVFVDDADLSNMFDERNIKVDQISHSTKIEINERGTEASAVTVVNIQPLMAESLKYVSFHVNRPFFFFIYNRNIDSVLFYGTVYDPIGK